MAGRGLFSRMARGGGAGIVLLSAAVTFGIAFCYVAQPRLLQMLDYKIYDAFLATRDPGPKTAAPIIIDIDEASLAAYGQWPWPRVLLADLVRKLQADGVAAVGVDIILSEPDRSSPSAVRENLIRMLGEDFSLDGLPDELRDYDRYLARHLNERTVLGMRMRYDGETAAGKSVLPKPVKRIVHNLAGARPAEKDLPVAASAVAALPVLRDAAPSAMLDVNPDSDGVIRRVSLVSICQGQYYTTLALRCLMAATGKDIIRLTAGPEGLFSVRVGGTTIPVATDGSVALPFRGPARTFPYYSAKDVLDGKIGAEALTGRIAFIGTSASGLMDLQATPRDRGMPGVEVHATLLDGILAGDLMRTPLWMFDAQVLAICGAGLLSCLIFGTARPRVYIPAAALLVGAALFTSFHLFTRGLYASPLYSVGTILLSGAALLMLRFLREEKQKHILRDAFSRYVAPEVVERVTRLQGNIFEGEERELTIMFTDIRGFTEISEKLPPKDIVRLLNRYFTPMTALVRSSKGTLDKFIGDALMAFWNAPLKVPGHAALAVESALTMHHELAVMNEGLLRDFGVELRMGIGLHTGKAYVGNMGSEELINYTLIGDNVNLASRLEGLCGQFGVGIAVSAETRDQALAYMREQENAQAFRMPVFRPLDSLRVKGRAAPVLVYAVQEHSEGVAGETELQAHAAALAHYRAGDFTAAARAFASLAKEFPADPIYAVFCKRLEALCADPPKDWDGVWTMTGK